MRRYRISRSINIFLTLLITCLIGGLALSQNPPVSAPKASPIINYLTETINWYRGTAVEQQIANEPGDMPFLEDNRRISSQIVRLTFDFARLEEQGEARQPKGNQTQTQANALSEHQRLIQAAAKADQQVEHAQNELQSLRQKLETTPRRMRPALTSLIAETESELAFRQARRDVLHNMLQFANESSTRGLGAAGLRAQIEELARLVPDVLSKAEVSSPEQNTPGKSSGKISPPANTNQSSGMWGLAANLLQLSRKMHLIGMCQ